MVADRAWVLIGGNRSPGFARFIGRLEKFSQLQMPWRIEGLRDNIGPWELSAFVYLISTCSHHSPFQTDREQSARVGNIAACVGMLEVGEMFADVPSMSRPT